MTKRAVDRYGVTKHGEQYQGFRALPAAPAPSPTDPNPRYEAAKTLVFYSCLPVVSIFDLVDAPELARRHYIEASKKSHPDNGGSSEASLAVQEAWKTLQER